MQGMSTQISSQAEAAREQHRDPRGKFGTQPASEATGVELGGPQQGPDGSHPAAVALNQVFPFEGNEPAVGLSRVSIGGGDYVTDRYSAIRADHVRPQKGDEVDTYSHLGTSNAFVPADYEDTDAPDEDSNWSGTVVGPLVKAGYEIRAEKTPGPGRTAHHVFRDGEHVGFVMDRSNVKGGPKGVRFKDVPAMNESVHSGAAYRTWDKAHDRFETTG